MDAGEPAETLTRRAVRRRDKFGFAFAGHAGVVPASERWMVSLSTPITVIAAVSVPTAVAGVFWSPVKPTKTTTANHCVGVSGLGYTEAADQGFEAHSCGSRWRALAQGGWSIDSCRNTLERTLLSGEPDSDKYRAVADWWFTLTTGSQCKIRVYVPKSDSAFIPTAHYEVREGRSGDVYVDFAIGRSRSSARWVDDDSFPPCGPEFAIRLTGRGVPASSGGRIAISAMKVTCG